LPAIGQCVDGRTVTGTGGFGGFGLIVVLGIAFLPTTILAAAMRASGASGWLWGAVFSVPYVLAVVAGRDNWFEGLLGAALAGLPAVVVVEAVKGFFWPSPEPAPDDEAASR
jgi:hypothetical protein